MVMAIAIPTILPLPRFADKAVHSDEKIEISPLEFLLSILLLMTYFSDNFKFESRSIFDFNESSLLVPVMNVVNGHHQTKSDAFLKTTPSDWY
jgi:hypothetical protein